MGSEPRAGCEPQAVCEPRAGCEPPAGYEPRAGCEPQAVNRRQCVNLAVYKGRSLCEGVFLKGPGRLCPRLKGRGPLGWFLLKQRRKHMALRVVGSSSALCRQPWPFSDFSGSFGNLMEVAGTSQRKTQCLACDFSSLRACGSLCVLPVQGRGSPQGEGRGEGPPPSLALGCCPRLSVRHSCSPPCAHYIRSQHTGQNSHGCGSLPVGFFNSFFKM